MIARIVGRTPPRIHLPRAAIFPLAYIAESLAHMTKREPFVTVDGLRMARHRMFFTCAKARRELGFEPRPVTEALADAIAWFREQGMIK